MKQKEDNRSKINCNIKNTELIMFGEFAKNVIMRSLTTRTAKSKERCKITSKEARRINKFQKKF